MSSIKITNEALKPFCFLAALILPLTLLNGSEYANDYALPLGLTITLIVCCMLQINQFSIFIREYYPLILLLCLATIASYQNYSNSLSIAIFSLNLLIITFILSQDIVLKRKVGLLLIIFFAIYFIGSVARTFFLNCIEGGWCSYVVLYESPVHQYFSRSSGIARIGFILTIVMIYGFKTFYRFPIAAVFFALSILLGSKIGVVGFSIAVLFNELISKRYLSLLLCASAMLAAAFFVFYIRSFGEIDLKSLGSLFKFNGRLPHWEIGLGNISFLGHGFQYDRKIIGNSVDNAYINILLICGLISIPIYIHMIKKLICCFHKLNNISAALVVFVLFRGFFENGFSLYSVDQIILATALIQSIGNYENISYNTKL